MKKSRIVAHGSWIVMGLCLVASGMTEAGSAVTSDRIVAIVNDDVITERDVHAHASQLLQQPGTPRPSTDQERSQLHRAVLEQLIEHRLMVQEATRRGLKVPQEEVERRLEEIRRQAGTPEEYDAMLTEAGLTEEQLISTLREQLLVQRLLEAQIRSKIEVSPTEVADAASHSTASAAPGDEAETLHLLIRVSEQRPEAEAKRLIDDLRSRLAGGAPFEQIARDYSESPDAQAGGRLGWVRRGEMLPELDAALFALSPDQLSEPVRTRLGFHLVKPLHRRTVSERDAADEGRSVEMRLYRRKFAQRLSAWLSELKEKAYIKIINE